jgi:hypothetical protein
LRHKKRQKLFIHPFLIVFSLKKDEFSKCGTYCGFKDTMQQLYHVSPSKTIISCKVHDKPYKHLLYNKPSQIATH